MIIDSSGILSQKKSNDLFHIEIINDNYFFNGDNIFYELEDNCIKLYDTFQNIIFNNSDLFYRKIVSIPLWVRFAGHDSDINISKNNFERLLNKQQSKTLNKYMYLADCQALITATQDRFIFIRGSFINFYINLSKVKGLETKKNAVVWVSGEKISSTFSDLYNIFIMLYSTFDLITKIAYELENIRNDFSTYPKLTSSKILFGAKKRINNINKEQTIFEKNELINTVINIRNELIHNGSWEVFPKIFIEYKNKKIIKKWILFPDTKDGIICSYKNRKRFFGNNEKINEKLPIIVLEVVKIINNTLKALNQKYEL